ncbi:Alpha/Beta hydrolase protein [Cercophora newfieldiana]|uniref:Alpha/Beta hydrolase protein n=1 Tax=Cercophora newfieldiana TaxID=92897 RepID=A0AA40CIA9_9PEZI|nr:Alpha/Beta hydrolase protein [Cercophora newfieldiana]
MRFSFAPLASAVLLLSASATATSLLPKKGPTDPSVIAHEGTPKGNLQTIQNVTTYIARPKNSLTSWPRRNVALIYLTDVFGIELVQNRLLADSFARAGYLTIAPDIQPGITKIALAGFCWGGKYAFRFLAAGKGGDAAFTAHPSLLLDDGVEAVTGPVSVAFAEHDEMLLPLRCGEIEALLLGTGEHYQNTLYSGTPHGFGVRADISDEEQRFGKEEAFLQAVKWFDAKL